MVHRTVHSSRQCNKQVDAACSMAPAAQQSADAAEGSQHSGPTQYSADDVPDTEPLFQVCTPVCTLPAVKQA